MVRHPLRLVEHPAGTLPFAIQDPAAVSLPGGGVALLGGLGSTDLSLDAGVIARRGASHVFGHLPHALHDAPAVRLGARVYVFGGGDGIRQLAGITAVDLATGAATAAGSLPAASSDSSATSLRGTAYVVGGFTGTRWLDTIVAWRPHGTARVVAHLPSAVRYAAVTSADGVVVVAGGSLPNGTASDRIWTFDPRSGRVRTIGRLPEATTHGAAAAIGGTAFVIGGRGATLGTPTARILAIDPKTGRVHAAGRLAVATSDLAAVATAARSSSPGAATDGAPVAGRPVEAGCSDHAHDVPPDAHLASVYAHDGADMLGAGPLRAAAHLRPEQRLEHGRRHRSEHVPRRRATTRSARCPSTSRRPGT